MILKFTKMHGAGNDFVVIDAINQHIDFTPAQWKLLADRRFGVGADQTWSLMARNNAGDKPSEENGMSGCWLN